jgi:hypothetical protein
MFNIFKEKTKKVLTVKEPVRPEKSVDEMIEEIHESFYTEVDKLLAEAKISHTISTDKQNLIDKSQRLKNLGFRNTKEVVEAQKEISRLNDLKSMNRRKESMIEAIEYFSAFYPNYKFITEDSVKKICAKYNLVYGTIDRYIGTVPDRNLKHMEDFKIKEEDACYIKTRESINSSRSTDISFSDFNLFNEEQTSKDRYKREMRIYATMSGLIEKAKKSPLEICAPLKDFNMKEHEVKDFKISKIEIPDPVVLQPVFFKGTKHYLIVTAWGVEASDELVVNHNMN